MGVYARHADDPEPPPPPRKLGRVERAIAATRVRDNQRFLLIAAAVLVVVLLIFGPLSRNHGAPPPAAIPTQTPSALPSGQVFDVTLDGPGSRPQVIVKVDEQQTSYTMPKGEQLSFTPAMRFVVAGAQGKTVDLLVAGHDLGAPGAPGQSWIRSFTYQQVSGWPSPSPSLPPTSSGTASASASAPRRPDEGAPHVRAEIVGVGTELLLGQIANTNARWMSERLAEIGVDVLYHQVVGDNLSRIVEVIELAASRADVVLVTGGLGPTQDDITRDAIAEVMGAPMVRHPEIEATLRERFAGFGRGEMPRNNLRQADVPDGARYIAPQRGTAPGLIAELAVGARLYAVPGVPAEMVEMMEGTILPELVRLAGRGVVRSKVLRCTGIGESRVAELVADLFEGSSNPSVAYLASAGEVKVRLTAKAETDEGAAALIEPMAAEVRRRLGDVIFTEDDETLEAAVGRLLQAAGATLACAESLTGGSVGARLSSVPGASAYFLGSAVVYSAEAKHAPPGSQPCDARWPGRRQRRSARARWPRGPAASSARTSRCP